MKICFLFLLSNDIFNVEIWEYFLQNNEEYNLLKNLKNIDDYELDSSLSYFHNINNLYIIFNIGLMTVGVVILYFLILLYMKVSMTPRVFRGLAPGLIDLNKRYILSQNFIRHERPNTTIHTQSS